MTYRVRNIGIAVGLAVLAALMISYYVTNYKRHVQQGASDVTVLVAAKDIPVGTSGAVAVRQHLLRSQTVVRTGIVPGAISNGTELQGLVSTQITYAGEQVTTRRFSTQAAQGVRSSLTGAARVLQLPGDSNQLLAGTLKEGDRVDVVGSWAFPDGSGTHVSRIVLRNLLVLRPPASTGLDTARLTSGPGSQLSVQLQVSDAQAQKLYWILENGSWSLALRPPTGAADATQGIETSGSMLGSGANRSQILRQIHALGGGQ